MPHTRNVDTRNALNAIPKRSELKDLLDAVNIGPDDRELMRLRYEEQKTWDFIADTLGYSISSVKRRHGKILDKICKII